MSYRSFLCSLTVFQPVVITIPLVACSPSLSIPSNFGKLLLWENRSGLRVPLPSVCWGLCRRSISRLQFLLPRMATEQLPGPGMKGKTEMRLLQARDCSGDGEMRDLWLMSLCQSSLGITVLHSLWSSFLSLARRIVVSPRQFLLALSQNSVRVQFFS